MINRTKPMILGINTPDSFNIIRNPNMNAIIYNAFFMIVIFFLLFVPCIPSKGRL